MARPKSKTPTPGEIEILQVLWRHGVRTVHEVHDELLKNRQVALTTVASMMQLMEGKGQLKLVDRARPFRYEAALSQDAAKDVILSDIVQRLFAGSVRKTVLHVAEANKASKPQIQGLERLLNEIE